MKIQMNLSEDQKEKIIKEEILESLNLVMLRIDGYDVEEELSEKIKNVSELDPERGEKLRSIIRKQKMSNT